MIPYYFDNSSTTLVKPPCVAEGVAFAINNFANAGRAVYTSATGAEREIFSARNKVAKLAGIGNPLNVAFTSSFTDGFNLLCQSLVNNGDSVITTLNEHNSVLRPLSLRNCNISYLRCDTHGRVLPESFEENLTPQTRFMFLNHASNVTGLVADARHLRKLCSGAGIPLILDISQSFGHVPIDAECADIFVFTGHKGLFGPQGTGGIIVNGSFNFRVARTGGTGSGTFNHLQDPSMPDVFEAGTPNSHGIYGLGKAIDFLNETGLHNIRVKEASLTQAFVEGLRGIPGLKLYGGLHESADEERVPVASLNLGGIPSGEVSLHLWEKYSICTRPGIHCAPLLHTHLGTEEQGTVRFSFSYFNTIDEVQYAANALRLTAAHFGLYS